NGCEIYLEKYPQGMYRSQIDSLIGDAFLNSEEYNKAITFFEKIPQKNLKMQYDYQKILYNKAVESSSQKEFPQALSFLKKSLTFPLDDSLSNNAYFWLGELYSVENQYDSANLYYQQVFKNTPEYAPALYGIAQSAYQLGKYEQAVGLFKNYLANETSKKSKRYATALTRIGDCFFLKNDIKSALTFYGESAKQSESDLAYNMYQKAISLAALKDLKKTKPAFDSLIKQFPDFEYIDDAYYQRSAFLLENNRKKEALASFTELIQKRQESNFLPYALFQRAEIYLSQKQYADAITDYLKIIDKFPNTNSNKNAVSALFDLKNQGVAVGNIDHLFVGMNPSEQKISENTAVNNDPLALAKLDHDKGNYASAIKTLLSFIRGTPNKSIFLPQAYYLLASSYENTKKISEALKYYSLVTDGYQEDALIKIANISLEKGNFKAAVDNYKYVLDQTSKDANKIIALLGLVQVNFKLKNYTKCEEFAQEILDKKYTKFVDMAEMFLGKSALEQKKYAQALTFLRNSAQSFQIPIAAESQFWIGYVLRQQKDFSNSIAELAEVRKSFESQRAWINEAFLLIAENYIDLGDKFRAKEVLNSLLQEAKDAKIVEKAKARLAKI
ncbi:MAG: hypothetical protein EAZ97_15700, partial [Bacteroidetes bacterium]